MAYVPMTAGGGSMSETTLWTNADTTTGFAAQTVNLSDNISNYKFIAINIKVTTSTDEFYTYYFQASDVPNFLSNTRPLLGDAHSNNYFYYRSLTYSSDTALAIGSCQRNTSSSASSVNNAGVIPVTIKGLK